MGKMLASFPTEKITLLKLSGEVIEGIEALVDSRKIHIDDVEVNIEEGDFFKRSLPNNSAEYYKVTDRGFFRGAGGIPDHYQVQVQRTDQASMERAIATPKGRNQERPIHKLFISHASGDKEYVSALVELLEEIGLPDGSMVCTSVPGYGIPGGAKIYDWLKDQFQKCDLRVVFVLSHNYYKSAACLNEMGAAWVTKTTNTLLLLPGFGFGDISGCIDRTEIGIKLDSDTSELKHRLSELKDTLILEHELPEITNTRWERHRDRFIQRINTIAETRMAREQSSEIDEVSMGIPISPVFNKSKSQQIPLEASFLIVYAAESSDGSIFKTKSISFGTEITTGGKSFIVTPLPREVARWEAALEYLIQQRWVKASGSKGQLYIVTNEGYQIADMLKDRMDINIENDPLEEIKSFEE